ncbi:MAG: hypothetical protein HY841_12950 [Bacteroidetes bacterium]|nr:hypothetical protein [Bacteroidota bacterium]
MKNKKEAICATAVVHFKKRTVWFCFETMLGHMPSAAPGSFMLEHKLKQWFVKYSYVKPIKPFRSVVDGKTIKYLSTPTGWTKRFRSVDKAAEYVYHYFVKRFGAPAKKKK